MVPPGLALRVSLAAIVADVSSMPFCVRKEMDVDAASVASFRSFSVWLSDAGV